jgi:PAS domain S-box-containing protein
MDVDRMQSGARKPLDDEQRFRFLAESITEYALIILDLDRTIVEWNTGAEALLGYTEAEAIGKSGDIFFTPEDRAAAAPEMEAADALQHGRAADERWHLRRDGSLFYGSGIMQPLRDDDGEIRGFVKIFRDETRRKRAEEALARSNADLQQFAYITSHDLQEPLRTITSFVQLLRQRYEGHIDKQADEYINYILGATLRMSNLIRDLLAYSRAINADDLPVASVPLNAAVDWAVMNLNDSLKQTGGTVKRGDLPVVTGYEHDFVQLFQNLLSNALKFHGAEPPRIRVEAEQRDAEHVISVIDNGVGISPEHHERVFGVFKRLHGRDVPGTGIGLAICRRIVERNGGRIWVESEPGRGAAFRFTLPIE